MPPAPPAPPWTAPVGHLVDFVPGQAVCGGSPAVPVHAEQPFPAYALGVPGLKPVPATVTFDIDADGRPVRVAREASPPAPPYLYYPSQDLVPAFTAWRFAAGQPRNGCRIRFEALAAVATEAPVALIRRYYVAPHQREGDEAAMFRRIHPVDSDCIEGGVPKIRVRAYPAFEHIPQAPGTWSYSMTAFDIDRSGKPVHVRLAESAGNPALDRASIAAIARSRFAPEARHGCTYPYYRRSTEPLAAPTMPDKARFVPASARCPDGDTGWTFMPPLSFPAGFERRRIEGWAIIGYDVAPWGSTGNVRVLAAEPAAAFGEQAERIVGASRQAASPEGRTGCVDVVRFIMPEGSAAVAEGL
ncbi:energy transducer TonB [Sphingomonas sp. S2-65]|uniref:energy transducer TonB n=1 Tax=Sphingomonas sp. S2-65 TaxID=2903960 RepID=UPI001F39F1B8|nr:energy transducer TonB [Sphingomonas sp. S2-65]UYY58860.1 energy transducer TonB [Sphingomonas sp. S2-65]